MAFDGNKYLAVGSKVRIAESMEVPDWSTWDDDHGRISSQIKKRLQTMFFKGNGKITAEVVYIAKESEREKLRRLGRIKVRLRDPSGCMLVITADPTQLESA
ncbi:MAG: hypothetical protein QUV05_06490 [Phycisphaerae bacterium]|jgi:uncharacterized NAD(P)/FAD-binding protein YdhS|nr:hypothetical protein [Phycisphaerae bacterium]